LQAAVGSRRQWKWRQEYSDSDSDQMDRGMGETSNRMIPIARQNHRQNHKQMKQIMIKQNNLSGIYELENL
jgi:hypothetical protein